MKFLLNVLISSLIVFVLAYVMPGVSVSSYLTAIAVAVVLGLLNFSVKPILVILTLPITVFSLGLFLIVINALLILLAGAVVPGFEVGGFWWAVLFSIVLSIANIWSNQMQRKV